VDVFFVISGYVISASLASRTHESPTNYAASFYARRMIRLLPALLVCLLVSGLAMTLLVPHIWRGELPALLGTNQLTSIAAVFGLSNFLLVTRGDGYFGDTAELNPFTHTWSLGVEEQFYFIFPLLFFLWVRKDATNKERLLCVALLVFGATASLMVASRTSVSNPSFSFYMIFSRFWELALGALTYQGLSSLRLSVSLFLRHLFLLAALLLLASGFVFAKPGSFPYPWALLPSLGTAGVIIALHNYEQGLASRLLSSAPMQFFGRTSYSLYLWHWPVFVLFRWTTGLDSLGQKLAALAIALATMLVSYYWIETPIRQSQWARTSKPFRLLVSGLAAMVSTAAILALFYSNNTNLSVSVTRDAATWYPMAAPLRSLQGDCTVESERKSFKFGEQVTINSNCNAGSSPQRLFVLGDSHASASTTLLATAASRSHLAITLIAKGGCRVPERLIQNLNSNSECVQFSKSALTYLEEELRIGDTLLLSSFRNLSLQRALRKPNAKIAPYSPPPNYEEDFYALLKPLVDKGARVILEAPKPVVGRPLFKCSDWFNQHNPVCHRTLDTQRSLVEKHRQPVIESFRNIAQNSPRISIWDPVPTLCTEAVCPGFSNGSPVYMDENHISGFGNGLLVESFEGALRDSAGGL